MLSAEVEGWMDNIIQNVGFIPKPEEAHMLFLYTILKTQSILLERPFLHSFHLSRLFTRIFRPRLRLETKQSIVSTVTVINGTHLVSFYFLRKNNLGIKASMRFLVHSFSLLH